jgi:hydroxymethylbilane synthase
MSSARLRLGTRASPLARWQAEWVAAELQKHGVTVELVPITTQGDVRTGPLGQIGGQGLFTKEIQRALLADQIDVAVHSCKDLPTEEVPGLTIAAVPVRESTSDMLVTAKADRIEDLPPTARVGTGSLRRKAQLLAVRPDLVVKDIRGNVETRLEKLDRGEFDAIVLAEAGLKRLGLENAQVHMIPRLVMLPAVGQGALAIEARTDDTVTLSLLAPLDHLESHQAVLAERALLAALRAGCLAPVGAHARIEDGQLTLDAVVLSPDGRQRLCASSSSQPTAAIELGKRVANELLDQGAAQLIAAAHIH